MRPYADYIKDLETALPIMKERGDITSGLEIHLNYLKAKYPNHDTRIDLTEIFEERSKETIRHLYCSKFDIYCIQTIGFVPDIDSEFYHTMRTNFYRYESQSGQ